MNATAAPLAPKPALSPSPPLPPFAPIPQNATLPGRINSATRKQHTELNRLLIQRLPLALPPHTYSPLLFSRGIVPFARIFILFEIEWEKLTHNYQRNPTSYSEHDHALRHWLASLRPRGLARSSRLRTDLRHLYSALGSDVYDTPDLGGQWVAELCEKIRLRPHVLVACAWVFYMALFSGGRWIRQQCMNTGEMFWTQERRTEILEKEQQVPSGVFPGISFLSFDGGQDGEDLKAVFKTRLSDAEWLLSDQEKEEVIETAQRLFDRSIELVNELDRMVFRERLWNWSWKISWTILLGFAFLLAWAVMARGWAFLP